jgi:hypothetical protein
MEQRITSLNPIDLNENLTSIPRQETREHWEAEKAAQVLDRVDALLTAGTDLRWNSESRTSYTDVVHDDPFPRYDFACHYHGETSNHHSSQRFWTKIDDVDVRVARDNLNFSGSLTGDFGSITLPDRRCTEELLKKIHNALPRDFAWKQADKAELLPFDVLLGRLRDSLAKGHDFHWARETWEDRVALKREPSFGWPGLRSFGHDYMRAFSADWTGSNTTKLYGLMPDSSPVIMERTFYKWNPAHHALGSIACQLSFMRGSQIISGGDSDAAQGLFEQVASGIANWPYWI